MRRRGHLSLVPAVQLEPAAIVRQAEIAEGTVFWFGGRPLKVVRTSGSDATAPVILEELTAGANYAAGQYCLWSHDAVLRVIAGRPGAQLYPCGLVVGRSAG